MFDNYLYVSSTSKTFRKHFEKAADKYVKKYKLNKNSTVLDIGSNDGVSLKPLLKHGINIVGVEPAANVSRIANDTGIPTINSYFTEKVADKIEKMHGKMDLITASNVFAHADDLKGIVNNVFKILKPNGAFIVEVQYLLNTLNDLTFDNIYHEHVNYWSVTSISNFFCNLGYKVIDVEHVDTHGGSIRVYVGRSSDEQEVSVNKFLKEEEKEGLLEYSTYKNFAFKVSEIKRRVNSNFDKLRIEFKTIAGYGSPAKATTFLNYFGIGSSHIDYIIEDNPLKNGKYLPGVKIPIKNKEYCYNHLPDLIVVMAWNFFDYIKENNKDLINKGVKFINIKDLQNGDFQTSLSDNTR
jgi:SAM-dependent methyltransferase